MYSRRHDPFDDLTVHKVVWEDPTYESPEHAPAAVAPAWRADDVLRVEHVAKRFGGVVALRDVSLRLGAGEALGLVGDNGCGKSTLINMLSGLLTPDVGRIMIEGSQVELKSVDHARALGIECVYQDLALVDEMPVWQNVFLHRELVHRPLPFLARRRMRAEARSLLAEMGVQLSSMDVPVGRLSGGERQAVAVTRSLNSEAKILLLDEPTAARGAKQSALILNVIARLRELRDVSIILVGHNHPQVLASCDRVNSLEDGRIALDKPTSELRLEELVRAPGARSPRTPATDRRGPAVPNQRPAAVTAGPA